MDSSALEALPLLASLGHPGNKSLRRRRAATVLPELTCGVALSWRCSPLWSRCCPLTLTMFTGQQRQTGLFCGRDGSKSKRDPSLNVAEHRQNYEHCCSNHKNDRASPMLAGTYEGWLLLFQLYHEPQSSLPAPAVWFIKAPNRRLDFTSWQHLLPRKAQLP